MIENTAWLLRFLYLDFICERDIKRIQLSDKRVDQENLHESTKLNTHDFDSLWVSYKSINPHRQVCLLNRRHKQENWDEQMMMKTEKLIPLKDDRVIIILSMMKNIDNQKWKRIMIVLGLHGNWKRLQRRRSNKKEEDESEVHFKKPYFIGLCFFHPEIDHLWTDLIHIYLFPFWLLFNGLTLSPLNFLINKIGSRFEFYSKKKTRNFSWKSCPLSWFFYIKT